MERYFGHGVDAHGPSRLTDHRRCWSRSGGAGFGRHDWNLRSTDRRWGADSISGAGVVSADTEGVETGWPKRGCIVSSTVAESMRVSTGGTSRSGPLRTCDGGCEPVTWFTVEANGGSEAASGKFSWTTAGTEVTFSCLTLRLDASWFSTTVWRADKLAMVVRGSTVRCRCCFAGNGATVRSTCPESCQERFWVRDEVRLRCLSTHPS